MGNASIIIFYLWNILFTLTVFVKSFFLHYVKEKTFKFLNIFFVENMKWFLIQLTTTKENLKTWNNSCKCVLFLFII